MPLDNQTIKQHLDTETNRVKKVKPVLVVEVDREPFTAFIERFVSLAEDGTIERKERPILSLHAGKLPRIERVVGRISNGHGNPIDYDAYSLTFPAFFGR